MLSYKINAQGNESIIITGNSFEIPADFIPASNVFIITDTNVKLAQSNLFPEFPVFVIAPGESSKNIEVVANIFRWLMENDADRSSFILGIGGGVVSDLAGFVASTFLRGIDFGFIATSLLAQVDASIGGKNGVNLDGFKNIIGTINQPRFVICDVEHLKTLPEIEFLNGMAEIIKHALIADVEMFNEIEDQGGTNLKNNLVFIEYLVRRSVEIKAKIVQADEKEKNLRRKLNLGHTWGHAVEKITGMPHGHAVSTGLAFAAELSCQKGTLSLKDKKRIISLLEKTGLPVTSFANKEETFNVLLADKKRENDFIHFVLMHGIGNVLIEPVPIEEIKQFALK